MIYTKNFEKGGDNNKNAFLIINDILHVLNDHKVNNRLVDRGMEGGYWFQFPSVNNVLIIMVLGLRGNQLLVDI